MSKPSGSRFRKFNSVIHRDFGYFFAALIIAYSISGIALNHVDEWNPDFIIIKEEIKLSGSYQKQDINPDVIREFSNRAGETSYRLYDFPSSRQVKIYYKDATLMVDLQKGEGLYEKISRRPFFYQVNVLHRNSVDWWKWASDVFAAMLIIITISGLLMLRGANGFSGRGKWFFGAGFIPPVIALVFQQL